MLDRTLYRDRVGAFTFDRLACLRNEYAKNTCQLCIEQCEQNAFVFEEGKLRLSPEHCTQCGACVGVCPTKALFLYGFSLEPMLEKLKAKETVSFTCKESLPCLGALSVEDWIVLLLEGKQSFTCQLSLCAGCSLNSSGNVLKRIERFIEEANAFVAALGLLVRITPEHACVPKTSSRRAFFRTFLSPPPTLSFMPEAPLVRLKKALKTSIETSHMVENVFSFIHAKQISPSCDNCKECVQFCPTKALSYNGEQTKILFQMGQCIGCHICDDICKKGAIQSLHTPFDVVHLAYNRAEVLIEHDLQVCLTCKCAFSYKGGEKVCERCASFEKEHGDLFTLASQSEGTVKFW